MAMDEFPFELRLSYRGLFRKVVAKGRWFELVGSNIEGEWLPAGETLNRGDDHRLMGIAFRLEGAGAEAFYMEYRVHCGRKGGDSLIAGESPRRPEIRAGEFVQKQQPVEGIQLAIWPRELK